MPHQSLLFLPFLAFLISSFIISYGNNNISAYCHTSKCGDLEVRYPFWLKNNITGNQYCGYQFFGLDCLPDQRLILGLSGDDFQVKYIDYASDKVILVDRTNLTCPRPRQNLILEDLPLKYSEQDLNLTFYFNCTHSLPAIPVDCLSSGGNRSYVSREMNEFNWLLVCEKSFVTTVIQREINDMDHWDNISGAMNEGFMLDWHSAIDCAKCETSKGNCGYNNISYEFFCYCRDGTIKFDHCKAILFTIFSDGTLCFYTNSSACTPQNCGNGLNIEYPFWIPGRQESYCGLPRFNITCRDKKPVLKISDDDYIIRDIFYSNNSILLSQAELYDDDNRCPTPRHNFSIEGTPFSYCPETVDLFFFFNCTKPYDEETYAVSCASNASHHAFAVFHVELLEHWNYSEQSCQPPVNAPVTTDILKRLVEQNYTDVMKKGFVLQWDGVDCINCQNSGGHCGYYNEFFCHCDDYIHRKTCDDGRKSKLRLKIGIGFGAAAGSALIVCIIFFVYQRRHKKHNSGSTLISKDISSRPSSVTDTEKASSYLGVHIFAYSELEEATDNFDSSKELGDGGFGTVYKGKLKDGRDVAVKRLYESNYKRVEQFRTEVEILTRLRHRNLVSLYGCTSRHCRELLLVYEYIPNGTVADHVHGELARPGSLPWTTRMNIAIETANALSYLHASDVIHRDVKTNNILLDNNFSVKVADFGLSRLFPINATHISTAPQGTPGYVDPEYHQCYHLTDKSDVYSFGVVLIELISSMPAVDITRHRHEINLSNIAINRIQNHTLHELVGPHLGFESDDKVRSMITEVAELAFQCLQYGRDMRPSMQEVLKALLDIQSKDYSSGKKEEMDIQADDVVLLKTSQQIGSPDSVIAGWVSNSITPSTSN